MFITIRNLGPIEEARIDLTKPLTILCGMNSTGKTYAAYVIYHLLHNFRSITFGRFEAVEKFNEETSFEITADDIELWRKIVETGVAESLPQIFGIPESEARTAFSRFGIEIDLGENPLSVFARHKGGGSIAIGSHRIVRWSKAAGSNAIVFKPLDEMDYAVGTIGINAIVSTLVSKAIRDSFLHTERMARMLTVERNSIYTFKSELTLHRLDFVEEIAEGDDTEQIVRRAPRYPQAVSDSLRTAADLENVAKRESGFPAIAEMLESDVLKGAVSVGEHGEVLFSPSGANDTRLRVQMSSSLVKTLSSLDIYLRHLAAKGEYLIIDEPEMNLHPELQRLLARVFARMVNEGIRLIISTHSDYIIREINALIMAHSLKEKGDTATAARFAIGDSLMLAPGSIQPLFFTLDENGRSKAQRIAPDDYGFQIASIDAAIDSQNEMTIVLSDALDSYQTEE